MKTKAYELVNLLKEKGLKISTAESCTGGMISSSIVDIDGASAVLDESHVTYTNEAKMKYLNVKKETLDSYGAVSRQTVKEMIQGLQKLSGADVSLAVSGLAGPTGGTKEKPVGLVYIGCNLQGKCKVEEHIFKGDRIGIRQETTKRAIELAIEMLIG